MILLIDNYDSFVYNLYQLVGTIRPDTVVIRNDQLTIADIEKMAPDARVPENRRTPVSAWKPSAILPEKSLYSASASDCSPSVPHSAESLLMPPG